MPAAWLGRPASRRRPLGALADLWLQWQKALPPLAQERHAESTLPENEREPKMLKMAFGHLPVNGLQKSDGCGHLDACLRAVDKDGNAWPRAVKGNKRSPSLASSSSSVCGEIG